MRCSRFIWSAMMRGKPTGVSHLEKYTCGHDMAGQCDFFMAEVSGSSFGLGFETGYLLGATAKKVVLFYRRDVENKISLLITGLTHPNCTVAPYSNIDEVEIWIQNHLS